MLARTICGAIILLAACISILLHGATFWSLLAVVIGLIIALAENSNETDT